ncbi:MAG: integration host factor subunit beta [Tannerella sp.]|jgi:DNA-binding protein HU-beta|nr:integration host factor subunit beta [Tannerella sp.]
MTKAELISLISKKTGVEKSEVLSIVTSFMDTIKKSLDEGENVYLRGFGSFIVKKRAEKKARNISKNTTIVIEEHNIPAFKPAKVFKDAIAKDKKKAKKKK